MDSRRSRCAARLSSELGPIPLGSAACCQVARSPRSMPFHSMPSAFESVCIRSLDNISTFGRWSTSSDVFPLPLSALTSSHCTHLPPFSVPLQHWRYPNLSLFVSSLPPSESDSRPPWTPCRNFLRLHDPLGLLQSAAQPCCEATVSTSCYFACFATPVHRDWTHGASQKNRVYQQP
ncbi:hypothetical protein BCV70DRAFT_39344 [Testicularia cyperi]|uniref:Uncharacterized protein n=1 Tax=Testicularia cyperi TaxID=1882483 RepID=A0A317XL42_9BASI|nr:hypothetical protein BCV70DRAFT_39344 [Testicularia cyperi]